MRRHDDGKGSEDTRIRKSSTVFVHAQNDPTETQIRFPLQQLRYYVQCSSKTDAYITKQVKVDIEENRKKYCKQIAKRKKENTDGDCNKTMQPQVRCGQFQPLNLRIRSRHSAKQCRNDGCVSQLRCNHCGSEWLKLRICVQYCKGSSIHRTRQPLYPHCC